MAEVVVGSQLHRFARICECRFRVVFRQIPVHLQPRAQTVCGGGLRVELENLIIELPYAIQRREPILYPAKIRLLVVRVGQKVPCRV